MNDQPETCTWEITMQCDQHCMHCGSQCSDPLPDELTTQEALKLVDQIGKLGVKWITIMGGEPLMRKDWHLICHRLHDLGLKVQIISNGVHIDEETVSKMVECGVGKVYLSIDGLKELHDQIRTKGSYDQCEQAFVRMRKAGINCFATTTLFEQNIDQLSEIEAELKRMGVGHWQLQIGAPMGNLGHHQDMLLDPKEVSRIIDFAYQSNQKGDVLVHLSDCIGYYSRKEVYSRMLVNNLNRIPVWAGCNAGIRSFGILHNGDIVGCSSLRSPGFVEGNIREQALGDLWHNPASFTWRRKLTKEQLGGVCRNCIYGDKCLGGCTCIRFTNQGSISSENPYCVYAQSVLSTRS